MYFLVSFSQDLVIVAFENTDVIDFLFTYRCFSHLFEYFEAFSALFYFKEGRYLFVIFYLQRNTNSDTCTF